MFNAHFTADLHRLVSAKFLKPMAGKYCLQQTFMALACALFLVVSHNARAQTVVLRANNTTNFNLDAAWVGGVAPTAAQIAGFSTSNTATSATSTIAAGVNFSLGGISFVSNPGSNLTIAGGAGASLSLGVYGIDTSAGTRVLTVANTVPVTLVANQTWTTGTAPNFTSQIVVNSVVSGPGSLTINGTAGSPLSPVYLNALNTFEGGVTLNAGGSLRLSGSTPVVSGGTVTSSSVGTGNLTLNGGTIFGGSGTLVAPTTSVTGDIAVNYATNGLNGRLTFGGGTLDLNNGARTVSLGRFTNAPGALTGNSESFRFLQSTNAPTISVTNGDLRFARGSTGTAADFVSVNFGAGTRFEGGAAMTIGSNVITAMASGNPFGTSADAQPRVSVETGGYFNLSDAANARSPQIRNLAGAGTVANLANITGTNSKTATLTINLQAGDDATFSGAIVDGATLNAVLGTSANGVVAITKTGTGIQRLSGSNSYTGLTTVSAGQLWLMQRTALYGGQTNAWAASTVVSSNATLGLDLGAGGFTSEDVQIFVASTNTMRAGALLSLGVPADTTAVISTVLTNAANPGGVGLAKSGNGTLVLSGYTNTFSGALQVNGGTLEFSNLTEFTGVPSISGGAVLDLGGASFAVPNSVVLTNGTITNFTAQVSNPFSPTSNVAYTGFSFGVQDLVGNGRTFSLTNSTLTVSGNIASNAFTVTGATNGVVRVTGTTSGQSGPATNGAIAVQGGAVWEFAAGSAFESLRRFNVSGTSNPTLLVTGGSATVLDVIVGAGSTNTGTVRVVSGEFSTLFDNGIFMGQNGGTGFFRLEGGTANVNQLKSATGGANVLISGGVFNVISTNEAGSPANVWGLSGGGGGTVDFEMTGGQFIATNSFFGLGNGTASTSFSQSGGSIDVPYTEAQFGTFLLSGGTNRSGYLLVGKTNGASAAFTVSNTGVLSLQSDNQTLLRLGDADSAGFFVQSGGSVIVGTNAKKDISIGFGAGGSGRYELNGGVLELTGEILQGANSSSDTTLVLNGGLLRSTAEVNRSAFLGIGLDVLAGSGGALIEVVLAGVTNQLAAQITDLEGQAGRLVKSGAGALSAARGSLSYSGTTEVSAGSFLVSGSTANSVSYTADIGASTLHVAFAQVPADGDNATILPGALLGDRTVAGSGPGGESVSLVFDAGISRFTVQGSEPTNAYDSWLTNYPSLTGTNASPEADPDGDGFINNMEFAFGGNPTVGTPALLTGVKQGTNALFTFVADTNAFTYNVQSTSDLRTGPWTNNPAVTATVTNSTNQTGLTLTNYTRQEFSVPSTGRDFFRVEATTAP
jgi:autotransporter-associated beta strand protein